MSIALKLENLSEETTRSITDDLRVKDVETNREICKFYRGTGRVIYIPLAYAHQRLNVKPRPDSRYERLANDARFVGTLRPQQREIFHEATRLLTDRGYCVIALPCGFGKTVTAIKTAHHFGGRTAIIVNKRVLVDQWIKEITAMISPTPSIQIVSSKTNRLTGDFVICNPVIMSGNAGNGGGEAECRKAIFWKSVETVIVDELHLIVSPLQSSCFFKLTPRRVLGLSATPMRYDSFNAAISWIFGPEDAKLYRSLHRPHIVRVTPTSFNPFPLKYNRCGGIDWNDVLDKQAKNLDRNNLIIDRVSAHPDRCWLILVKRIEQAELLKLLFEQRYGRRVASLFGSMKSFDKSLSILIGTTSKIGTGFDHADINALCIAADMQNYFQQFLGRCMRKPVNDKEKILVQDFMDESFGPFNKHLKERINMYEQHGGIVTIEEKKKE